MASHRIPSLLGLSLELSFVSGFHIMECEVCYFNLFMAFSVNAQLKVNIEVQNIF